MTQALEQMAFASLEALADDAEADMAEDLNGPVRRFRTSG